jgi:acetyl-CoA C-acetyltransferase
VRSVSIVGIGQTKVKEHFELSLRELAVQSIRAAMADAGVEQVDALYVSNMISGEIAGQEHLGALIADYAGLRGIEAMKVEAACGGGGAALRLATLGVASGAYDLVAVCGVEKMTEKTNGEVSSALMMAADADYEAAQGITFVGLNALLMRRYMHEYGWKHEDFAPFSINAHANAVHNEFAMFPRAITLEQFKRAPMIADPINLLDSSPICDGSATVIICPTEMAARFASKPVRIAGSAIATDSIALHDRTDILWLKAAYESARAAYRQAGCSPADIDLFEVHDAFTITAALSLEAAGFSERGQGVRLALEGAITREGKIPIATMGGLKGRGHPVGASGIYQVVEVVRQLRGEAGKNQVPDARIGMAQSIGGSGATVVTHILEVA